MTSSEDDDDLEDRLRRALSEAADGVEPGSDGLDKIRSRIAGRPPRPWLVSVLFGWAERVRYWTWRGHWAWPDRLSRRVEAWWSLLRRARFPAWGIRSLGLAAALAAVALIASVTLGVQPLRNAFNQAGSVLQGGGGPQSATAGTEANGASGAPDIAPGNGSSSPGAAQAGTGSSPPDTRPPGTTKAHNAGAEACATSADGTATAQASLTNVQTSTPATAVTSPAVSVSAASVTAADSVAANATAVTCPVSPTKPATATVTPTAADTSTASSGDWTPVTGTPTPTVSGTEPWPTPTDSASASGDGGSSPSDAPSWPGKGQQPPHHSRPGHGHRH